MPWDAGHERKTQSKLRKAEAMISDNDNIGDPTDTPAVFIIIGQTSRRKGGEMRPVHVMLTAPDEDTAVRLCLDALSAKGYAEADLDQIGELEGPPDEEPHAWPIRARSKAKSRSSPSTGAERASCSCRAMPERPIPA